MNVNSDLDSFATAPDNPMPLFNAWLETARASEPNDAEAMALATRDDDGAPDVRIVLLKGHDDSGFRFYSNAQSAKGVQLNAHPYASLCWHWKSLRRQIRARGRVVPLASQDADAYFATRSRNSRIGAWGSEQSRPLASRAELRARTQHHKKQFGDGEIPRPPHWCGWLLRPLYVEFWRDGTDRLHERLLYSRNTPNAQWTHGLLFP